MRRELAVVVNENFKQMTAICKKTNFTRRGNAFFRILGDGVLQVLKYSKEEYPFRVEMVKVGLFSLYSELMPQWLTSKGCIPLYNYRYIVAPRWELEREYSQAAVKTMEHSEDVLLFRFRLDDIISSTIPFLDRVNSQEKLIEGIDFLEYRSKNREPEHLEDAIRWTDMNKYSPYLYEQKYEKAERIVMAILETYSVYKLSDDLTKQDPRAEVLRQKALLAKRRDDNEIRAYLLKNFQRNKELTLFCKRR